VSAVNLSLIAQEWNELRLEIIEDVVRRKLMPVMEQEARQRLLATGKDVALDK